ncbi:hypothetical protein LWI28_023814 [Acer negundo]|uniref:Uncharacterized protein n=1 Tax=Acer negundo TaxID=4023 RepID=A0AAD5NQQ6_ACENE|nr:hypothetical protein LWI28_023814 [Acer negundo]
MTSRRATFTIWMRSLICHTNGCTVYDSNGDIVYRVDNYDQKCRDKVYLMDLRGQVLFTIRTKVNRKQTSSGILLGEDVLSLRVEPRVDHSFIVALVIVYGLINGKM